ncbi:hypothetical protein GGER_35550 [Serratia rubidaea]
MDEHAEHRGHVMAPDEAVPALDSGLYDRVLQQARAAGIDANKVEIRQPQGAGQAWSVSEIDRSWPTQVDAVAVDPHTLAVTDSVRFASFPLAAKLTRWGIDLHMGILFGLVNELVLVAFAVGLVAMVIMGYLMWWRNRPTRAAERAPRSPLMLLRRTPKGPLALILLVTLLLGYSLPVLGASIVLFLLADVLRYAWLRRRQAD